MTNGRIPDVRPIAANGRVPADNTTIFRSCSVRATTSLAARYSEVRCSDPLSYGRVPGSVPEEPDGPETGTRATRNVRLAC